MLKPKEVLIDLPGFPTLGSKENENSQKKSGKSNKKSGGFQSMGLSFHVLKGITKRGYKIPTPIQRKTIPLILEGRDIVAMAKTGSGKTACFLIPMFEKLKQREPTNGARALVLAPTRELAVQTYKFIKEIGKFLDLKTILVLGGDSMDSQFSAIHTCPDVIVATPGRFLHLCVEMDLKLGSIEYVVFDEADRLFEMGFGEQLNETINRLPSSKQLVMFSATLPKQLVEFAKAGLSDPVLIRLDVDTKVPEGLQLKYLHCRPNERYTALLCLLKYIIPSDAQTVVFAGTQHHVELISLILTEANISNTSVYSSLDPSARKINVAKFVHKKVSVLVVTDVAARGIDIPSLDYVVNLHFPGKAKLFVHRVGRCARAGRNGTAFSIFSTEDQAHMLDLHLFLNRPFNINDNNVFGIVPQDILEEEHLTVMEYVKTQHIAGVYRTSENAYKKYISTRPVASTESNKRVKIMKFYSLKPLEEFMALNLDAQVSTKQNEAKFKKSKKVTNETMQNVEDERKLLEDKHDILLRMKKYKPNATIFEMKGQQKTLQYEIMKEKRIKHSETIEKFRNKMEEIDREEDQKLQDNENSLNKIEESNDTEISTAFDKVITQRKRKSMDSLYKDKSKNKIKKQKKDSEYFIPYESIDKHTEKGFAVNSFERQAQNAEFSVVNNTGEEMKIRPGMKRWDRVKKKMVGVQDPRAGKIKTESGIWIPSSFKTGRYNEWREKTKFEEQVQREAEEAGEELTTRNHNQRYPVSRHARHNAKVEAKKLSGSNSELKTPEQIVKQRLRLEQIKKKQLDNKIKKTQNRKKHMRKMRAKGKGKK